MADILRSFWTRRTRQSEPADPRQVPNAAGGFVFEINDVQRLRRFLTLGVDSGTFYVGPGHLTRDNAHVVLRMAESDHATLVDTIVQVSEGGAAPRQNPALFALAIAASHGTSDERARALAVLPRVARTGTHLFLFAGYIEQFRGWGRGLRRAVGSWYLTPDVDAVAFQAVKYRQREGWSHRDLLRLAHPKTIEPSRRALFEWIVRGTAGEETPRFVEGFLKANEPGADVPALVREYGLSWEMLPDEALGRTDVWDALLDRGIPQTALMRQLNRLTRLGMLPDLGGRTTEVAEQLVDPDRLRRARVHPINVLVAQRTYAGGQSVRGSGTWSPSRRITDALDAAFYAAFGAVEPAGKRTLLALDVSGSMAMSLIAGMPLSPRVASAALALVQMATEPQCEVVGFTSGARNDGFYMHGGFEPLDGLARLAISPRQRLDDAVEAVSNLAFGGTDCALPMRHALATGMEVDTFVIYTDNETWAGGIHPHQALVEYRQKTGIPARMIVVGMTATRCSIADPNDPGMLDIAGFDAAVPSVISEFSRGL